ncbi:ATP-dependent helicase [Xylanibacillus composti]|uniref:DNA 3'-5' helicase n=1 Tax=Xylanibacillus composti TaxID=1572762 RepID=A0A8J4M4X1_9BACL|nr:ATP-dependent helicase [Xylanibacillus composti]MDT9723899.1 ATP-dependent helicase [Xylanibacillus composti]GIQ71316.1 hypothetical protein XYCOK13_41400 [Xylanibacillus composti]
MNNIRLSTVQQNIVSFDDGALLVKASAGSGKTRVLTERIKRLIKKTNRKILAVTFTNKAGEEMKERLGNLEGVGKKLFVGNFHGFCQQVLENHGKLIGLTNLPHIFEDETDRLELIAQAIENTPSYYNQYITLNAKEQRELRYKVLDFISKSKRNLLSEEDLLNRYENQELVLLYSSYQDILSSQNAIDFDDLILLSYSLFIENPKIAALYRRTYEYICVDEAQDLNYAQYQLLRSITSNEYKNVMMVGDPNQSIFAFNGSSADFMTENFVEDYQPTVIELQENYRSSKAVLQAADRIIPNTSNNFNNTVIEGIFEIHKMDNEQTEALWVSNKINELIHLKHHRDIEGEITYEKIAVLARNKYVFKELTNVFEQNIIPYFYKITPGSIKFESKLMKIFELSFRVRVNPKDSLHWIKLLNMINEKDVGSLSDLALVLEKNEILEAINVILGLKDDGSNFKSSLEKFKVSISENDKLNDDNEKKMILNDIKELLEHWHEYDKKTDKRSLLQFKTSMALGKTHPLSQKNGVTLSTVHTMKGQEYDIVFLLGMDDETFPDYRAIRSGGTEMIQERNNAYVAFTRSKRFLYVTWPQIRLMPWGDYKHRSISRFIREMS